METSLIWLQTKVAHLLGVVGTDVPEADLREAMSPHIVSKLSIYFGEASQQKFD